MFKETLKSVKNLGLGAIAGGLGMWLYDAQNLNAKFKYSQKDA